MCGLWDITLEQGLPYANLEIECVDFVMDKLSFQDPNYDQTVSCNFQK